MNFTKGNTYSLLIATVCFWFGLYVHVPYQSIYLTEINVIASMIGIIIGSYGMMQLFLRLPVGIMADRAGNHRIFILTGIILTGLSCLIRFLLPNGFGFLVANIFSGCGASTWISYMVMYCSYFNKVEQQKATGQIIMACNLGMCLGFIFSSIFYSHTNMLFLCFAGVVVSAIGVLFALTVKRGMFLPDETTIKPSFMDLLSICTNKRLIFFSTLAMIQQGIQNTTAMAFTTNYLKELGASADFIGYSSVFYMFIAVASAYFASTKLSEYFGPRFFIPVVFVLTAIYCIWIPFTENIYLIFSLQAFPGLSTGILLSYLTSESMIEVPVEKSSTAMGLFQSVYSIGLSIFPIISGALISQFNICVSYGFLSTTAIIGGLASIVYYKRLSFHK